MGTEYDNLCSKIRSDKLADADLPDINANIQDYFRRSCSKGHKDIAEWLYLISKMDCNIKVLINADHDLSFRQSCENGHSADKMVLYIRNMKVVLQENDLLSIGRFLMRSGGLKRSGEDCMVCLGNDAPYWIKLECGHEVCSNCFMHIDECPLRCGKFNSGNVNIIDNCK
jgi:hypothetical protein